MPSGLHQKIADSCFLRVGGMWIYTRFLNVTDNNNTSSHLKSAPVCESPFVLMDFMMSTSGVDTVTAAARRRQRRLRAYLRYARMSVAMALAGSTHHTSRGQKNARAGVGREMNFTATNGDPRTPQQELFKLSFEEEPGGGRPGSVTDPRCSGAAGRRPACGGVLAP